MLANNVGKALFHKARMRDYVAPECAKKSQVFKAFLEN